MNAEVTCTTITQHTKAKKYIAFTFDEGPSARSSEILDILKEKDAKATFFVSGDKVAAAPAAVKAIAESGNELGTIRDIGHPQRERCQGDVLRLRR